MNLKQDWKPTALLVMEHRVTGLRYFCKTSQFKTFNKYKGSGLHWKRHLKKHGRDVDVGVLGIYFEKDRCLAAAKKFSEENNIGSNAEWANLIPENGMDGAPLGEGHPAWGKPSPCIGQKRPWVGKSGSKNPMYGKPSPMRGKKNIGASFALKGRKRPQGGGKKPNAVIKIDANGIETRYDSVSNAGRSVNGCRTGIHQCCNGKAKTAYGYKWRYAEEK